LRRRLGVDAPKGDLGPAKGYDAGGIPFGSQCLSACLFPGPPSFSMDVGGNPRGSIRLHRRWGPWCILGEGAGGTFVS